uniref:NAD+ synthase n=1 Tax=Alistipes sp. TaxID=1872444 RepID=UPI004055E27A
MKIALAQLNFTVGDVEGNSTKIIGAIHKAKELGADLVLFAEHAISGTPCFDLLRKTTFLELCEDALVEIASCCDGIAALVGMPLLTSEGTVSAAALIQDRKVLRYITKKRISARREMGFLVDGKGYEYATIKGRKCAIVVGDDLRYMHDLDKSVQTIISINARKYGKGLMSYRYQMMHNLAFMEGKELVIVNQVGGSTDLVYDGTSGVLNSRGELVTMLKSFEEDFQIYDTESENHPTDIPYTTYNDRTRMIYKAARLGLRDFFHKNGYYKAAVGLSGGIDSAVVACLAADALGKENVRALLMPSRFSSDHSVEDAKLLAERLGIEYNVIPINEIYTSVIDTLKPAIGGTEFDLTEENIQTRIRTILLMAVQNKSGYILLNCSNKSENALGWCTLYGDTAGAFSPTGDLYKSEMYDLARYINREFGDVIPENILDKEPSSELRPDQKDSDILPPYEVIDAILYRMIEKGQHREEIINAGFDSEVVEKIHSMIMRNEKKRYQFPPVLRLSSCAFGHERLMPLTNKYGDLN